LLVLNFVAMDTTTYLKIKSLSPLLLVGELEHAIQSYNRPEVRNHFPLRRLLCWHCKRRLYDLSQIGQAGVSLFLLQPRLSKTNNSRGSVFFIMKHFLPLKAKWVERCISYLYSQYFIGTILHPLVSNNYFFHFRGMQLCFFISRILVCEDRLIPIKPYYIGSSISKWGWHTGIGDADCIAAHLPC
jgi:hypothetical protein